VTSSPGQANAGSLDGKLVVVTGAGRGLGLAIAEAAGIAGAEIVIAERDTELAASALQSLVDAGIKTHRIDTDVADPGSVSALAAALADLGPVHGLVNNAALANGVGGRPFWDIDTDAWDRLMTVNARGPWLVTKALWPHLARPAEHGSGENTSGAGGSAGARASAETQAGASIVNLASDAALYGSPRLAHYITSKGAVMALTKAMARDAGPEGITVNAVAPGLTLGEAADEIPAERHELYRSNRALARPQEASDLTGAVTFLLSDAASYITGQTLVVDGGFVFH
jgi:NAD(P)-dependent dehydrogenase (short-subunit alcohol dehydrogenase family)